VSALDRQADELDSRLAEAWPGWSLTDRAGIEGFQAEVQNLASSSGVDLCAAEARRVWALAAVTGFPEGDSRLLFWAVGAGKVPGLE